MSKPLSSRRYGEFLNGKMAMITVGFDENKTQFYVHQNLLNSVTDAFAGTSSHAKSGIKYEMKRIELPKIDVESFKMFLSWLYNNNRTQEMKTRCYTINSLLHLYGLSVAMKCDTLKSDTLYALLVAINKNANTLVETVDSMFKKYSEHPEAISGLHTMLDRISELTNIELDDVGSLLELYVSTINWGNEKWQNRVIDSIGDKLCAQKEVLDFDQITFIFEGTKNSSLRDDKLRNFCAAMVYYRRNLGEGSLKPDKKLKAEVMERFLTKIDGFMAEYLRFEDEYQTEFPGGLPKDPRSRDGELGNCYFHFHQKSDVCTRGMDLDA